MGTALVRLAAAAALVVGVAACSSDGQDQQQQRDGTLTVVATTDVWASVVSAIGGPDVAVTSIISGPAADPHSYQVSAKDAATLREADLVVSNGGGYDDFVDQALQEGAGPARIVAFEVYENTDPAAQAPLTGSVPLPTTEARERSANEHVWYDLPTVGQLAQRIAFTLGELQPPSKAAFAARAATFQKGLDALEASLVTLATAHVGAPVAATEPVAFHLLSRVSLRDLTPAEFTEAVEEENDPPAAAVAEIRRVVSEKQVSVLVHNPQTETPVVADLVEQARTAGVPVVELTETLPDGQDYLTWMGQQIAALSTALA